MDKNNIGNINSHENHRSRLKRRFIREGLDGFEDHNALELLLFFALPRRDTNELAHRLIERFGSLSGVFDAEFDALCETEGISEHTAALIKLIPELSSRYRTDRLKAGKLFCDMESIGEFLVEYYYSLNRECVTLMLLDNKCALIDFVKLSEGSVNSSDVNARRIAEIAFSKSASSIILAHNHPKGEAVPSDTDIITTKTLKAAFDAIDLHLSEHILVSGDKWVPLLDYICQHSLYKVKYLAVDGNK